MNTGTRSSELDLKAVSFRAKNLLCFRANVAEQGVQGVGVESWFGLSEVRGHLVGIWWVG